MTNETFEREVITLMKELSKEKTINLLTTLHQEGEYLQHVANQHAKFMHFLYIAAENPENTEGAQTLTHDIHNMWEMAKDASKDAQTHTNLYNRARMAGKWHHIAKKSFKKQTKKQQTEKPKAPTQYMIFS